MSGMSVSVMKAIFARHPQYQDVSIFVETGTGTGHTIKSMKSLFKEVHTIELSRDLYNEALQRFGHAGIHFHFGDSPDILAELAQELIEPAVWFLDAHYDRTLKGGKSAEQRPLPLKEELQLLRERSQADIVIVDDVHAFGSKRPEPETGWAEVSQDLITQALDEDRIEESAVFGDQFVVYRKTASPVYAGEGTT